MPTTMNENQKPEQERQEQAQRDADLAWQSLFRALIQRDRHPNVTVAHIDRARQLLGLS